jgi:hypothetical protein
MKKLQKRNKLLAIAIVCVLLFMGVTVAARLGNRTQKPDTVSTAAVQVTVSPASVVMAPAPPEPEPEDATESIATFLQGPKSWKARREWSGKWGTTFYDGGSFGGFGCGLCCMANIYCSLTDYRCSPIDMYRYAKKTTGYGGGGAIDWGYMKKTLESAGFVCRIGRKPEQYQEFQNIIKNAEACIVVVSSNDSTCYWKNTPGHYVTLFLYDEESDKIFLGDSGDPDHNRQWVSLKKVYRSLKTSNNWQYMTVGEYDEQNDNWKHKKINGTCVLPERWK